MIPTALCFGIPPWVVRDQGVPAADIWVPDLNPRLKGGV